MKFFKKAVLAVLCVCLMGANLLLTGCGNKSDLTVFLFGQSHEVEIYSQLIQRFTDETGITVDYTVQEEAYFDTLAGQLLSNTAADVFYVRPGDVRALVNENNLVNLSQDNYVTEDEVSGVWKQAIDFFRYDGTNNNVGDLWALPKDYSQYILGFNDLLIQKESVRSKIEPYIWNKETHGDWETWAGVPLSVTYYDAATGGNKTDTYNIKLPGWPGQKVDGNNIVYTYDEFGALAYLCTAPEGRYPQYGTAFWEEMCLMGYVWGADGEFLTADESGNDYGKVNFQSPEFQEGYQGFIDLQTKWHAHADGSTETGYELFVQGKLVFYPVGTWDIAYFSSDEFEGKLDYDIMPWPISNSYKDQPLSARQNQWKARVDSVGYGIYAGSSVKEEAATFIKYLSINESGQEFLVKMGAQIPNIESMAKGAYLNNEIKDYNGKDLYPANKQLLLDVAAGPSKNGHFGPTVYTYNDDWWDEFFQGAAAKLWDLSNTNRYTIAQYCEEYAPKSQEKLDAAKELEASQRQ